MAGPREEIGHQYMKRSGNFHWQGLSWARGSSSPSQGIVWLPRGIPKLESKVVLSMSFPEQSANGPLMFRPATQALGLKSDSLWRDLRTATGAVGRRSVSCSQEEGRTEDSCRIRPRRLQGKGALSRLRDRRIGAHVVRNRIATSVESQHNAFMAPRGLENPSRLLRSWDCARSKRTPPTATEERDGESCHQLAGAPAST